jgi:hypothetical protein
MDSYHFIYIIFVFLVITNNIKNSVKITRCDSLPRSNMDGILKECEFESEHGPLERIFNMGL